MRLTLLLSLGAFFIGGCSAPQEARSPEDVLATEQPGREEPRTEAERALLARLDSLGLEESMTSGSWKMTGAAPYSSASGMLCRSVFFERGDQQETRLTCRDESGWFFAPAIFAGGP